MDYDKLGLKVGLEIHQQLNTKKLFCNCSSEMKERNLIYEVERKLRPVMSELGEMDRAALFEFFRNRRFVYHGYEGESCLVELDEEPPHKINKEALEIALSIALRLGLRIPDEIHVMRKLVLDGSAVTSFQRTAIVGYGEAEFNNVRITSLCLEEDAARKEKVEGNTVFYSLSRLGIPLVEISTKPDMTSPQQVREFAESLGLLLRSFNVKRGIGTIRQDVNISIKGGARVEIKGWQDLWSIDKLVENEVERQVRLLEIRDELKRMANIADPVEVSDILGMNVKTYFIRLKNFSYVWLKKIWKHKTFRDEMFEYATVYNSFIFDSLSEDLKEEFRKLKNRFGLEGNDIGVIIYGGNVEEAVKSFVNRVRFSMRGIPEETRKPLPDATTSFSRPLPGSARMYPETDHPPIVLSYSYLAKLRKKLPETLLEKRRKLEKIISKDLAGQIIRSKYFGLFEKITKGSDREFVKIVASTFTSTLKDLKRQGLDVNKITDEMFVKLFNGIKEGKIAKKSIPDILISIIHGEKIDEALRKYRKFSRKELESLVRRILNENKDVEMKRLIGLVMRETKGRADAKDVMELLKKLKGNSN